MLVITCEDLIVVSGVLQFQKKKIAGKLHKVGIIGDLRIDKKLLMENLPAKEMANAMIDHLIEQMVESLEVVASANGCLMTFDPLDRKAQDRYYKF